MEEKKKVGFALWSKEDVQRVSSMGGKAAHAAGTAHEFTKEEAVVAGRKGGRATQRKRAEGANK